jgi:hypothetical protein
MVSEQTNRLLTFLSAGTIAVPFEEGTQLRLAPCDYAFLQQRRVLRHDEKTQRGNSCQGIEDA